jgi:DMSO/TMAO reductase YedYZ molybdopterin-dependent catalytic subunit
VLRDRWPAALAGFVSGAVALATAELVAGVLPGGRSPFVAVADAVIALAPGPLVNLAVAVLGAANRPVLVTAMLAVAATASALAGIAARRRLWAGGLVFVGAAVAGGGAGLGDPLLPAATAVAAPAAGAVAGIATLGALRAVAPRAARRAPADPAPHAAPLPSHLEARGSRRRFLVLVATAAGAAAAVTVAGRGLQERAARQVARGAVGLPRPARPLRPPPAAASLGVEGLSPLITPNDRFYRIDTAFTVPRINPDSHSIGVSGMVERPFDISYDELIARADTEADVHLACVSNEVGGDLVGNARWLGVPLADLLDEAGVQPGATQVIGRAVDGWTAGFPVDVALDGRPALVAVGMNGELLPDEHGFPVRLVVAGLYGYVSDTKWLSEIELSTFEAYDAYWIRRGWAREGPIKTQSRIDVPRHEAQMAAGRVAVAGVAWAGERGIDRVEVAVDDTWHEAELAAELAATSWRQWLFRWDAEPGQHVLRVRATDGAGATQTAEEAPPQPDGATGHHAITVAIA